jgi:hypothetical protein
MGDVGEIGMFESITHRLAPTKVSLQYVKDTVHIEKHSNKTLLYITGLRHVSDSLDDAEPFLCSLARKGYIEVQQ